MTRTWKQHENDMKGTRKIWMDVRENELTWKERQWQPARLTPPTIKKKNFSYPVTSYQSLLGGTWITANDGAVILTCNGTYNIEAHILGVSASKRPCAVSLLVFVSSSCPWCCLSGMGWVGWRMVTFVVTSSCCPWCCLSGMGWVGWGMVTFVATLSPWICQYQRYHVHSCPMSMHGCGVVTASKACTKAWVTCVATWRNEVSRRRSWRNGAKMQQK